MLKTIQITFLGFLIWFLVSVLACFHDSVKKMDQIFHKLVLEDMLGERQTTNVKSIKLRTKK